MDTENLNNYDIIIDIDSLFDTRLPILFALSPDTMQRYLDNGEYYTRTKDSFGDIPMNVFKGFYKNRDKRILLAAKPTEMFNLLTDYITSTQLSMTSLGDMRPITIYLNTYPYNLLDDELNSILRLLNDMGDNINVKTVNYDNYNLTPKWINKNVGVVIMYDSLEWLDINISYGTLPKTPLLEILMMGPQLITGNMAVKDIKPDTFNTMIESMNTLIGFNFIRTNYYCMMKSN